MTQEHTHGLPRQAALEQQLKQLFAGLLELDHVGDDDDFFALGGDSLAVIRLVARMRQQLSVDIQPGDIFDHPTVSSLAGLLLDMPAQGRAVDSAER